MGPRRPDRDVGVAPPLGRLRRAPASRVAGLVQIGRVVQRDRFEEDADAAVDGGRGDAGPQHRGRVVGPGRRRDDEAGDVAEHGDGVVVVEVAAEALLVAVAGDAHDERVAVLALGEELQRRRLAPQLVLGVVQVGQVLDLRARAGGR